MDGREDEYFGGYTQGYEKGYQAGFEAGVDHSTEYERGWNEAKEDSSRISQKWYEKSLSLQEELRAKESALQQACNANKRLRDLTTEVQDRYDSLFKSYGAALQRLETLTDALEGLRHA